MDPLKAAAIPAQLKEEVADLAGLAKSQAGSGKHKHHKVENSNKKKQQQQCIYACIRTNPFMSGFDTF